MNIQEEETRLFFVTDSIDDNEEIFETLEQAEKYLKTLDKLTEDGEPNKPRLRICLVHHAYQETWPEGHGWNYEDFSDTFQTVRVLKTL